MTFLLRCAHLNRFQNQNFWTRLISSRNFSQNVEKTSTSQGSQTQLPSEADVVIIGGGSLGCNTLYSLAKLGVTNTVLLEKDKLTAGTTWHTAGIVWSFKLSETEIQLLRHTQSIIKQLEEETGINPGWINNGGMFIADTKERFEDYKRLHTLGNVAGLESHLLTPAETQKIYPLMKVSDIYGSFYSPGDGTVDPSGLCTALTKSARRAGAKVFENCPVTNILTESHSFNTTKIIGVETAHGTIKTNKVVNCTGAWANYITNKIGIHLPIIPMKHAYITTEKIPGIENMPNARDQGASFYLKLQGDALCVGGYETNPIILDKVQNDFAFGLYELDWDVFGGHIKGACNRIPSLENIGIKSTVCGPEAFTPDARPIMGEDPRVRGFFHGVAFNSGGMMLGGGCGNELAKWVLNGRPDFPLYSYDVRRFCPDTSSNKEWIKEKSHESYAKGRYSTAFSSDEPLAGRGMKRDALHQELENEGCVYQERHGWERPGWFVLQKDRSVKVQAYDWYGAYEKPLNQDNGYFELLKMDRTFGSTPSSQNIKGECLSTRYSAALFNTSYVGKLILSGPDAQKAADYVFTNKMDGPTGKTVYTCMLNKRAGVEADLTVSIRGTPQDREFYIVTAGDTAFQNLAHIRQTIQDQGFNVTLEDNTRQMGTLSLQGPKSREILQKISDADLSNEEFPFATNKQITVAGHQVLALRVSYVGELGWELHIPNQVCVDVYRAIMEAGRPLGLVNGGYRAINALSTEKGFLSWNQDLRIDDTPLESGLLYACKLQTQTDFLGRVALETQLKEGAKKKRVCVTLEDGSAGLNGIEGIYRNGVPVGYIRRAAFGFCLEKTIAFGYVQNPSGERISDEWIKSGDYEIEMRGQRFKANVHHKSPFDPMNLRAQGDYTEVTPMSSTTASFLEQYHLALSGKTSSIKFL